MPRILPVSSGPVDVVLVFMRIAGSAPGALESRVARVLGSHAGGRCHSNSAYSFVGLDPGGWILRVGFHEIHQNATKLIHQKTTKFINMQHHW